VESEKGGCSVDGADEEKGEEKVHGAQLCVERR